MQKVIVRFPASRQVLSSGIPVGDTNAPLVVQDGLHHFSLDGAADFVPAEQRLIVTGTTPSRPMVITFVQLPALLGRWIPAELHDLAKVDPTTDAVQQHFAALNLRWQLQSHNGGSQAFAILEEDAATGGKWALWTIERSGIAAHRHNPGGDYGEMVVTLAGSLSDIDDEMGTAQPIPGPVAFRGVARDHSPVASAFWVGLFHQPRGITLL